MDRDMVSRFGDFMPKRGQVATSARTMTQNESIVEDAALAMPRAILIPAFSRGEKGRGEKGKHEAIRRLNPSIPEEATACALHADSRATIRQCRRVQIEKRLKP